MINRLKRFQLLGGINVADNPPDLNKPKSVEVTPKDIVLDAGDTHQLHAVALPEEASQIFTWHSSDNTIATMDDVGMVTCNKEGDVIITVKSLYYPHITDECNIHIRPLPTAIEILNESDFDVNFINDTKKIEYQISPLEANQNVIYSSSNHSIATIDENGLVTFLKYGIVTLTVTAQKGVGVSKSILCSAYEIPTSITLDIDDMYILKGHDYSLKATVTPVNAYPVIDWNIEDGSIAALAIAPPNYNNATVNGTIGGASTITATTVNGIVATCDLTVRDGFRWIDEFSATPVTLYETGIKSYNAKEDALDFPPVSNLLLEGYNNRLTKRFSTNAKDTVLFDFDIKLSEYIYDTNEVAGGSLLANMISSSGHKIDLGFLYRLQAEDFAIRINHSPLIKFCDKSLITLNTKYNIKIEVIPMLDMVNAIRGYVDDVKVLDTVYSGALLYITTTHIGGYTNGSATPSRYYEIFHGLLYRLRVKKITDYIYPTSLMLVNKHIESREDDSLDLNIAYEPDTANNITSVITTPKNSVLSGALTKCWGDSSFKIELKNDSSVYDEGTATILPVCPIVYNDSLTNSTIEKKQVQTRDGKILTEILGSQTMDSGLYYPAFQPTTMMSLSGSPTVNEIGFRVYDDGTSIPKFVLFGAPRTYFNSSDVMWNYVAIEGNEVAVYAKRKRFNDPDYIRKSFQLDGLPLEFDRDYKVKIYTSKTGGVFSLQLDDHQRSDEFNYRTEFGTTSIDASSFDYHCFGRAYTESSDINSIIPIAGYAGEIRYIVAIYDGNLDTRFPVTTVSVNSNAEHFMVLQSDDVDKRKSIKGSLTETFKVWPSEDYQKTLIHDASTPSYFCLISSDHDKLITTKGGRFIVDYQKEKYTGVVPCSCKSQYNPDVYTTLEVMIYDRPTELSVNIPQSELSFPKENTTFVEYLYKDYMSVTPIDGSPRANITTTTTGNANAFTVESRVNNMGFRIKSNGNYAGSTVTLTFTSPDNLSIPASSVTFTMV